MRIVAGVDGGGTGTTLVLSGGGSMQERKTFGPFNLNSIGEERYRELLSEIFRVIKQSGDCDAVCIGAAGISNPRVREIALETGREYGFSDNLMLRGDQEIALYGAMSGKAGAILISGTGSICSGRGRNGETIRAGGWGHLIDDVGSGYSIGRDVLKEVVRAYDGRGEKTLLTDLVQEYWKVSDMESIIKMIYGTGDKSNIAALSRVAEEGVLAGDAAAERVLEKNASELCELAGAVYERLKEEPLFMCLMGGLLTNDTVFRKIVTDKLSKNYPGIILKEPDMDAASGAALWAWDMYGTGDQRILRETLCRVIS